MNKAHVILITSPTCPHCTGAKALMESFERKEDDYVYEEYSMGTQEGQKKAQELGVMRVPTFIISGPKYDGFIGLSGNQTEAVMNKYIDIALGKQEMKEKQSFFKRLFGK